MKLYHTKITTEKVTRKKWIATCKFGDPNKLMIELRKGGDSEQDSISQAIAFLSEGGANELKEI